MALDRSVYRAFEDVVGPDYICDDALIMPAYFSTELGAIILPQNTGEVQAIVRLCNRFKLKFRAICTGWSGQFAPGTVLLDLRRMNRIIEINEKNMYAVVEPYVISAQLQAELMKRGLNVNIKGAGANCSAMLRGHGHMDQTTGGDDRNHLAVEWVTPEGDIVMIGSLGSSDEWFCGDGPGPSLRCLISSAVPPGVTPGVFTKCATKLYHWPGPARFPVQGLSPRYTLSKIPPGFMVRYFSFPSPERMYEAELKIGESEIAFELMGFNMSMVAANITTSNEEEAEVFERLRKEILGYGFMVIIAGNSPDDFDYKKRVLHTIISETGGKSLEAIEKDPEIEGILLCQCVRISASIRETFRAGGVFNSIPVMGQRDLTMRWSIGAGRAKESLIEKGLIVDDGGMAFGWGVEQGHLGKTEIFCRYDRLNPEAVKAVDAWRKEQTSRALEGRFFASGPPAQIGPVMSDYHVWWGKLQKALDPNGVSSEAGALV